MVRNHAGWALRASDYARVRIIFPGTNGPSSDQRILLVISTHSGGDVTHTWQNARCVGQPGETGGWPRVPVTTVTAQEDDSLRISLFLRYDKASPIY
jgi:hypothetical protein